MMPTRTVNRAKEAPDFIIDGESGALLNTNNTGLAAYRERRALERKKSIEFDNLKERVNHIEGSLNRIEQLLALITTKYQ